MKKVLIFSLAYFPHRGGAEVSIKEIAGRLPDMEFHLITLQFGGSPRRERIGNVEVYRVGFGSAYLSKILFVPLAALKAHSLARTHMFDAAWAMMSYMVFPLVLLRMMGVHIPYVLNLQDGDPFEQVFERWYILPFRPLLLYGFRNASVVQVLSNYLGEWARTAGYTGPIEVVPNGADCTHFAEADPLMVEHVQREIGKEDGVVGVVSTSRLVHKNALDDMIRALPLLPAHIHFYNFGVGTDKKKLEELARTLGVADRVHLLNHPGLEVLPAYLHACDIFIRASRTEGFGVSFVEAMAAGLPVIATQEGGLKDFITPEVAWVVEKDRPDQIALQIKDILGNPERTKKVIENARKLAFEKYDWDLIARAMQEKVFGRLFQN